jgi:hypothetical protein
MQTSLYSIKFFAHTKDINPISVKAFIVYGRSKKEIEQTARFISEQYRQALGRKSHHLITYGPLPIFQKIHRERSTKPINWDSFCQRQMMQEKTRDRKQGSCIFRNIPDGKRRAIPKDYKQEMKGLSAYSLSIHRKVKRKQNYLFVGSLWDNKKHCIIGKVSMIEASNLEHAADICELIYLSNRPVTTLTEWCCPIFSTFSNFYIVPSHKD